jgi:gamma-glutamyltranspeptidase/glutathione hydrolase/leukotriene-C4 hydrolase
VAADSSRCSEIGRNVLSQQRGNAIDAAVAVALCQGVVNPVASGLGGGAFIMVRLANGSGLFIDARETAPGAATADMFAGEQVVSKLATDRPGTALAAAALSPEQGHLLCQNACCYLLPLQLLRCPASLADLFHHCCWG